MSCLGTKKLYSLFHSLFHNDPWSDHKIRKWAIVSLDILITLKLCKLARLLSGTEFCSRDRIHFQTQPRYVVYKNTLFGCSFEEKKSICVWDDVSDAKTRAHECICLASWNRIEPQQLGDRVCLCFWKSRCNKVYYALARHNLETLGGNWLIDALLYTIQLPSSYERGQPEKLMASWRNPGQTSRNPPDKLAQLG